MGELGARLVPAGEVGTVLLTGLVLDTSERGLVADCLLSPGIVYNSVVVLINYLHKLTSNSKSRLKITLE